MDWFDKLVLKLSPPLEKNFKVKAKIEEENPDFQEIFQFTYRTLYPKEESKFGQFFLLATAIIPIFWPIFLLVLWDSRRTMNRVELFYDSPDNLIYVEILFGKDKKRKLWNKKDITNIMLSERVSSSETTSYYYSVAIFGEPQKDNSRAMSELITLSKSPYAKRIFLDFLEKLQKFGYPVDEE